MAQMIERQRMMKRLVGVCPSFAPRFAAACVVAFLCCTTGIVFAVPATQPAADCSWLPRPQQITLAGPEFRISDNWHLHLDPGVKEDSSAIEALKEGFESRHGLHLRIGADAGPAIVLSIAPGAVEIGAAQDRDRDALAVQAYRITLFEKEIRIVANTDAGLFYGVETLVQLATRRDGTVWLPAGEIVDWPDLQMRSIYWDDAHHLERLDALKHAVRQAAFFKIDAFVLKLEGHFQFKSAPAVVEPYALSPAEYQELTDYGLRYHVKLIPYLDAPAHIAFILKHPEYAGLRAFADSNYELSTVNPDAIKLIEGMCQDLVDANNGVDCFYLSTDEPYYLGMSDQGEFAEARRMKELGSPGKLLAEFLNKVAGFLHDRSRTVFFWGELPLKPDDVASLPPYLVNGETNEPDFDAAFKARGIRQMIYTSTEGMEPLFPNYAFAPPDHLLHQRGEHDGDKHVPRVAEAISAVRTDVARQKSDLMGLIVAGWADNGLNPETFWLGYATIASAGWNPAGADAARDSQAFYRIFYGGDKSGPGISHLDRIYDLLARQAEFWDDSWENVRSASRKGIWGNSNTIYRPRHPADDQTLPLPPVPDGKELAFDEPKSNERRAQLVGEYIEENRELSDLLAVAARSAQFNQYNIEVMQSIAALCRQNLDMLHGLDEINRHLADAHSAASHNRPADALAALDTVVQIRASRDAVLRSTTDTWYKSWQPRVAEANGRTFLHELDDVKDHQPDRTIGMEYLVYRELQLPLGDWAGKVLAERNQFAKAHGLTERAGPIQWPAALTTAGQVSW
jgi:hexosaminidase